MKYTLKVKRPCDAGYTVFVESKDVEVIRNGWNVARSYGWQFQIEAPRRDSNGKMF